MDEREKQANEAAKVACVVNVGDANETGQIYNAAG
jgi:hypothetical protein